mmetsp:Transcript_20947/g.85380  ORF Transcript_20947/g.85380 Transcript_20947/m.85380 type:complete len:1027 (-) Transcript_20947:2588-5668(-)|eukprot:CAMPEP_0113957586 /NCGR_PEP_ID=MMETSP0011_2-20120614/2862_1 /TAXON_ID=101924 /ORGANISM="Rhodosorus marinus" /LENGTH=1026 /DNA_ID=CAMNT_0000968185 /DNA_START=288 /DNA_END=3368 /DNA_ORIENTATION=+ /assembly_acc=CAM_ASM_000156
MEQSLDTSREVAGLLQGTLNNDADVRNHSAKQLELMESQAGYLSSLFRISAVVEGIHMEIRLSASIYMKNMIRRSWDQKGKLHDAEKVLIRDNLMEALVFADPTVRPQIAETIKAVVIVDFPEKWPGLLQTIMNNLQSGDDRRLRAALIALRVVTKVYEFKMEKEGEVNPRAALNHVVEQVFPKILELNNALEQKLVETRGMDDFALELQRYIFKIFWSSTEFALPPYILNSNDAFRDWMHALVTALRRPVSAEATQGITDPDELGRHPAWKVKKWLGHIMHKYFHLYGDPQRVRPHLKPFADNFLNNYAGPVTSAMLEVLSWPSQHGITVSPRVANLALNYIEQAIFPAITYAVIRERIDVFLTEIVFPYMCVNDSDLELWDSDPLEYVRKTYDVLEDFYSPRAAACNIVYSLGRLRAEKTVIPFLRHLATILNAYASAADGSPQKDAEARRKDGALLALGHVKEKLLLKSDLRENLGVILVHHVQPEFKSKYPFLRARTCWLFGQLVSTDSDIMDNMITPSLQGILGCLSDSDFPVRVQAAVDIRFFLRNNTAKLLIAPELENLFNHLFRLIDEIDNTYIIATIEELVQRFENQIPPLANALCMKLAATYLRAASAGDEDEESNLAAVHCLQAIDTVLQSLSQHPSNARIFQSIEPSLAQVFNVMFDVDNMEFFEESLDVLSTFIHASAEQGEISPYLWTIYPKIFEAFETWAIDFADHLMAPIENYISMGTETFLAGRIGDASYVDKVVQMVARLWGEQLDDSDADMGTRLAEIVMLNCKGRLDGVVTELIQMIIRRLTIAKTNQLRIRLFSNVGCALYYNPALTLRALSELGCVQQVFVTWIGNLSMFPRIHDKKTSVVGLSSILTLPAEALPAEVQAGFIEVITSILKLLELIAQQRNEREQEHRRNALELLRESEASKNVEFQDNEDAEDELTSSYRHDYDDSDDFFETEDEGDFESPLDEVDEVLYFVQSFREMTEVNMRSVMERLDQEQLNSLQTFFRTVDEAHRDHQNYAAQQEQTR